MSFLNELFQKITVTIASLFIAATSLLPGAASNTSKPVETLVASPSATISTTPTPTLTASPAAAIKPTLKPRPKLSPSPSPTPARVTVLLNDGTTVYCLNDWADEVKRAVQGVKDAEEVVNKLSDCNNSCSSNFENTWNDCRAKYPNRSDGTSAPELTVCYNKVRAEKDNCVSSCPRPSLETNEGLLSLYSNREKSKKFLSETRGEHCIDSK